MIEELEKDQAPSDSVADEDLLSKSDSEAEQQGAATSSDHRRSLIAMPVPLMIALVLIGIVLLARIGNLISVALQNPADASDKAYAVAVQGLLFVGLMLRHNWSRVAVIVLSYYPLCSAIIDATKVATGHQQVPPEAMSAFIASTTLQIVVSIAIIVLLSLKSVGRSFEKSWTSRHF